jgi:predicted GNAT superfamily acetyltransferase
MEGSLPEASKPGVVQQHHETAWASAVRTMNPVASVRHSDDMTLATSALDSAAGTAEGAARRAGVTVLELRTPAETERADTLLRDIWRAGEAPVPANLLRTVQHTGGYVFGAYDASGALVAVSMGLLATHAERPTLHSHITGVVPGGQRRGLGYAVKQHQRWWALSHRLHAITWTCDPLVRRNVGFNLHALGADVTAYLPDHYGSMRDGVNSGDESDRLEFLWQLDGPRAALAGEGRLPASEGTGIPVTLGTADSGAPIAFGVTCGSRLIHLPHDIEALRRTDPRAAAGWRRAVRDALVPALAEGAAVRGLTDGGALLLEVSP